MMTSEPISIPLISVESGPITILTLQDKTQLNLLSVEMAESLTQQLQVLRTDPNLKVLILTGSGQRAFCAGANMHQLVNQLYSQSISMFPLSTGATIPAVEF